MYAVNFIKYNALYSIILLQTSHPMGCAKHNAEKSHLLNPYWLVAQLRLIYVCGEHPKSEYRQTGQLFRKELKRRCRYGGFRNKNLVAIYAELCQHQVEERPNERANSSTIGFNCSFRFSLPLHSIRL